VDSSETTTISFISARGAVSPTMEPQGLGEGGGEWSSSQDVEGLLGLEPSIEQQTVGMDSVGQQSTSTESTECILVVYSFTQALHNKIHSELFCSCTQQHTFS
jgi:hypothetical protein